MKHKVKLTQLFLIALGFSLYCGPSSPTGKPGQLGKSYNAVSHYQNLKENPAEMPKEYQRNLAAIQAAFAKKQPFIKQSKTVTIEDGEIKTRLKITWETMAIEARHLILTASIEALEFSKGTSCTAGEFKRQDSSEPYFDMVNIEINCGRVQGSGSHILSRTFYFNGAERVNEPLLANGKLFVLGGAKISD